MNSGHDLSNTRTTPHGGLTQEEKMAEFLNALVPIGMAAVVIVLFMGIWNMMRGGSGNRSQMLMRWRVGLQFIVVVLVMGALYLFGSGR